jgi:hypothetical protein
MQTARFAPCGITVRIVAFICLGDIVFGCVPVDEDLTRVVYFRSKRIASRLGRWYEIVTFHLYRNWMLHYNFSDMDYDAMRSVRYQYPEYLSATDNYMVMLRWLIREHARDLKRPKPSPAAALEDALTVDGD